MDHKSSLMGVLGLPPWRYERRMWIPGKKWTLSRDFKLSSLYSGPVGPLITTDIMDRILPYALGCTKGGLDLFESKIH